MEFNRNFWIKSFAENQFQPWPCSSCNLGLLELQPDTFHKQDTGESALNRGHDAWEPEWIEYRFCALLICNNSRCHDTAALTGRGRVVETIEYRHGYPEQDFIEKFFPEYCSPPPAVFPIPQRTPDSVKKEILASFSIFFSNPDIAGNRIRACIEALLTNKRVNKTTINKKGKRVKINLHDRITNFGIKYQDLSNHLLAIKWLGNEASHTGGLKTDDILDAYEILHYVLHEIYSDRKKRVETITYSINKRKGKRSKKH